MDATLVLQTYLQVLAVATLPATYNLGRQQGMTEPTALRDLLYDVRIGVHALMRTGLCVSSVQGHLLRNPTESGAWQLKLPQ